MKPSEKIEELIKSVRVETRQQTDRLISDKAKEIFIETRKASDRYRPKLSIWRIIMRSPITKLAAAAVMLFIVISGVIILDKLATPAWAIEQTVKALGKIRTLVICGEDNWGSEIIPFKFQIRFSEDDNGKFDMRFESEKQIIVVRGTKAWTYLHDENTVKIYEDVTSSSGMMRDLRIWYKIAELNPWITGKMLAALKLFADDWQETYEKDEQTGQERVFVNCSFKPLSSSFWFVCETESKLIVEGKYWRNTERQGPPVCHAKSFTYNEELSDKVFDFQVPEGAKVINRNEEQEADILFARGEKLFEEKDFTEAIKVYREAYEKYPNLNVAETSLMMIGICHRKLGEREKAIITFEKTIREYGDMKGWIESTYFYLGCAYMDQGQKDKALEAFQNCIIMGEGIRDSDKFPLKDARENIERLKKKK
jgi:outer membrane lipoprotein-sorting protein